MNRAHPHDGFFKQVFSRPELAADLLRRRLPDAVLDALDLDRLEPVGAEFVDAVLRARRADLIFRAPLRGAPGREAFVFLLIEHQSTPDPLMAWRVLSYVVETWSRWIEAYTAEHGRAPRRLPAVIPLVVYQGRHTWRGPRAITDLIDLPPPLVEILHPYLPRLALLIDDLTVAAAAIDQRTQRALTAAALMTMRFVRQDAGDGQFLARLVERLEAGADEPHHRAIVEVAMRYLYDADDKLTPADIVHAAEAAAQSNTREALMTLAEKFKAIGREEGRAQGREEGREEGRAEGEATARAQTLIKLLQLKFGPPDARLIDRVQSATSAQLDAWVERILFADTLEGVFGPRG